MLGLSSVDTQFSFSVRISPQVKNEDLPGLSKELQQDFYEIFLEVLGEDPYTCKGLPSHELTRELTGWCALEIDECGDAYRLVYRINETLKVVEIVSFDVHDAAYDKAKDRTLAERARSR